MACVEVIGAVLTVMKDLRVEPAFYRQPRSMRDQRTVGADAPQDGSSTQGSAKSSRTYGIQTQSSR